MSTPILDRGIALTIIDIDAHFYEPFDWLETTDPELAALIPAKDNLTLVLTTAFGEVMSTLPNEVRPNPFSHLPGVGPDGVLTAEQHEQFETAIVTGIRGIPGAHRPVDRIAYIDAQGIDEQWILPTFAFNPISFVRGAMPELTPRLLGAYNRWSSDYLADHSARLTALPLVDLRTMPDDVVLAELRTARERGARSFIFWPTPVEGKSLAHPDFEWFWAACADLGMFPMIHVGAGRPAVDPGWLNNARSFPSSVASYLMQLHQLPEMLLSELILAGTFDRHPTLRVLVCELGIDWLPTWTRRIDRLVDNAIQSGVKWKQSLRPAELIRRHVRVSPLHGDPTAEVLAKVGADSVIFSSDYPHNEGGADALATFKAQLDGLVDETTQAAFFGGTIAADLALSA